MTKKILIATGGTGGHIYPALGLAEELSQHFSIDIAGNDLQKSPFLNKTSYTFHTVNSSRINFKNPFSLIKGCYKILKGFRQSLQLLERLKPDYIIGFGSFHTFPLLLAAIYKKVPIILHEGNAMPGKVNRFVSRFSQLTAIQFPEAKDYLHGHMKEAPLPLRKDLQSVHISQDSAKQTLNLQPDRFTILIFGGSLGASFLNELMEKTIPFLEEKFSPLQLIHITGNHLKTEELKKIYKDKGYPHFVATYHFDMATIWKAADLCICRSGASTIREMISFEVPAILVPYPYAADNHQERNAAFMATKVGGAFLCLQHELTPQKLLSIMEKLFIHKMATYRAMKQALRSYKRRVEKISFADIVKQVVRK